jgi:hypothetical protein
MRRGRAPNSDDDHTTFSHVGLVRREGTHTCPNFSLPPHCRSWSGIFQKPLPFWGSNFRRPFSWSMHHPTLLLLHRSFRITVQIQSLSGLPTHRFRIHSTNPHRLCARHQEQHHWKVFIDGLRKGEGCPLLCVCGVPSDPHVAFTPAQLPSSVRRSACRFGCQSPRPGLQ